MKLLGPIFGLTTEGSKQLGFLVVITKKLP